MKTGSKKRSVIAAALTLCLLTLPSLSQGSADPKVIEAAKKEGKVIWWTTMTLEQSKQMVDRFEKKYPFIKTDLYRTGGGPLLNKILAEARAGRHAWDVLSGRGEMHIPLMEKNLLGLYRSPEQNMFDADMKDKDGYWTAFYVNPYVLGFNTRLVKPDEAPRSYEALLDPKWKGKKISIDTEAFGLLSGLTDAWGREKAIAYLKKLAAQDPVPKRGNTERVQLTVAGEYSLIIAYGPTIERMTQKGAPIDWIPLEPVVVQVNQIQLAAKAPNPNAAKLFIDFALSKEGQEMIRDFFRIPPRIDVDANPPRLIKGYKRVIEGPEGYTNFDETVKLYQEVFKTR